MRRSCQWLRIGMGGLLAGAWLGCVLGVQSAPPRVRLGAPQVGSQAEAPAPLPAVIHLKEPIVELDSEPSLAAPQLEAPQPSGPTAKVAPPTLQAPLPSEPSFPPGYRLAEPVVESGPTQFGSRWYFTPTMFGDAGILPSLTTKPGGVNAVTPSARAFRLAENQSPEPMDRAYLHGNYLQNPGVNASRRLGLGQQATKVHRGTFGFEKRFEGEATYSLGVQLPFNSWERDATDKLAGESASDVGDLTVFGKIVAWADNESGSLVSLGLALTLPTGEDTFAHQAGTSHADHSAELQPFLGYRLSEGRFFVQGFSSLSLPTGSEAATLFHNNLGVGFRYFEDTDPYSSKLITALVPTVELHVTTPLSQRGELTLNEPTAASDTLALAFGATLQVKQWASIGFAVVTPLTGEKPFDVGVTTQVSWFYGVR